MTDLANPEYVRNTPSIISERDGLRSRRRWLRGGYAVLAQQLLAKLANGRNADDDEGPEAQQPHRQCQWGLSG